mgnify:CR=1 FL=1
MNSIVVMFSSFLTVKNVFFSPLDPPRHSSKVQCALQYTFLNVMPQRDAKMILNVEMIAKSLNRYTSACMDLAYSSVCSW